MNIWIYCGLAGIFIAACVLAYFSDRGPGARGPQ